MKTRYKFLIAIGIMVVGIAGLNRYSYNNYTNKQKERIELFFNYNYNIDSLTFTKTKKNPMGTLVFYGYFNDDKENDFSADIMPYQKEFEGNIAINGAFDNENAKFENGKTYSVSEIEKIQRKERRKNSEENSSSWFSDSAYTE
ncbi:hypothetical protein A5821_002528 [Enterococcus sp. 7F3_DIV0205]|uniref:DUF1433 domain-containing protein n=1 Tax=Candidatus Enterococcus palustris TaxID=1834189 RepID=A0AAQ3Y850_9ENTE|nr:DUF1433 domain-containing protein [Enterococcus sp. 7F3_DIV0205]OTN82959.1 hypothetical protein A5821_002882 [Enterococcus sp. 7F3_DIV0205]